MNARSSGSVASKRPLMSGSLCAIDLSENLLNIQQLFDKVIKSFIKDLRQKIVEDMQADEDWEEFVPYLSVRMEGTELVIAVQHPDALDLEYGTPDRPMNSKLRDYAYKASFDLSEALEKAFKKEFG